MADTPPSTGFRAYGIQSVRERLERMHSLIEAVRHEKDVEAVHDMRVATRRLRSALTVFAPAFSSRAFRRFERDVKAVTDALADARDMDVMIQAVDRLGKDLSDRERTGLDSLIDQLRWKRRRLQNSVVGSLDLAVKKDLPAEFDRAAERARQKSDADDSVGSRLASAIATRIDDLLAYAPFVDRPECVAELHRMRIAAKRLRYTLELFVPFAPPGFAEDIGRVRLLQELLGEIHDADVLVPLLVRHLRKGLKIRKDDISGRMVDVEAAAGLARAALRKRGERDARYGQFRTEWQAIQQDRFFAALLESVQNPDSTRESGRTTMGDLNGNRRSRKPARTGAHCGDSGDRDSPGPQPGEGGI